MRIAIAGGSGFVGTPLVRELLARGDDVAVLTRNPARVQVGRPVLWDGRTQGDWSDEVAAADAVVNLAGENIAEGRWTRARKQQLVGSRLDATRAIVEALRSGPNRDRTLVNASAVGVYGDRGDELLDEDSPRGSGFLADLVVQWEAAAREADSVARVVILRFGIVLAADGGALRKMMMPFRFGAGGPIGNGRQWMSWIAREDLIRMVMWALDNDKASGVYDATAPEPVTNREFTQALGRAMHRPAVVPVPAIALRLALGQMAEEALLAGQRVVPRKARAEGFSFSAPTLEEALSAALSRQDSTIRPTFSN